MSADVKELTKSDRLAKNERFKGSKQHCVFGAVGTGQKTQVIVSNSIFSLRGQCFEFKPQKIQKVKYSPSDTEATNNMLTWGLFEASKVLLRDEKVWTISLIRDGFVNFAVYSQLKWKWGLSVPKSVTNHSEGAGREAYSEEGGGGGGNGRTVSWDTRKRCSK